ncbi:hypothetical protein [Bacillus mycoides]|uniref:hypothetical protein n=1 Tax=Bacillus mycoides TaxID=1405 RepID=UPI001642AEE8|nr:hypothetical protein [Bacillus mycoides]
MSKYQVVYNVLSPDGRHYKRECLEIYAPTVEHARQGIENELKRRVTTQPPLGVFFKFY